MLLRVGPSTTVGTCLKMQLLKDHQNATIT